MLTINEDDFSFTVQAIFLVVSVVYETSFVAVASGVYNPVAIKIEEEGEIFAVVDDSATFGFGI